MVSFDSEFRCIRLNVDSVMLTPLADARPATAQLSRVAFKRTLVGLVLGSTRQSPLRIAPKKAVRTPVVLDDVNRAVDVEVPHQGSLM
jgi:hypothetical protein